MVAKIDEDKRCAPANNFGAISVSYIISDEIVDTFLIYKEFIIVYYFHLKVVIESPL